MAGSRHEALFTNMNRHQRSLLTIWTLSIILGGLFGLAACSQTATWEEAMAAGQRAYAEERYADAERMFSAAVVKAEHFGKDDPRLALALSQLGQTYWAQGKDTEAELQYLRALGIYQRAYGEERLEVAATLNNLGVLNRMHGQYAEAEPFLLRALAIKEKVLGPVHLDVALSLKNLGKLYVVQERYARAEPLYRRALSIREAILGSEHEDVSKSLEDLATLLRKAHRAAEAEPLEARAATIRAVPDARTTNGDE